jgi:hypothetical protein
MFLTTDHWCYPGRCKLNQAGPKVDKRVSCDKLARVFCVVRRMKSGEVLNADTRRRGDVGFISSGAAVVVASEAWASAAMVGAGQRTPAPETASEITPYSQKTPQIHELRRKQA